MKYSCCPSFKLTSFIVLITIVDCIMFIVSLSMSSHIGPDFLAPDAMTLVKLGGKYPYNMKKGYVWLFITPVFLHANFMHILTNAFS